MQQIGNEIKKIIETRQIKKKDFADYLGISTVTLSKIFKKESIDSAVLKKIADFFGVPVGYFFGEVSQSDSSKKINGDNNIVSTGNGNNQSVTNNSAEKLKHCEKLLQEKDKRIEELKEMISILKERRG